MEPGDTTGSVGGIPPQGCRQLWHPQAHGRWKAVFEEPDIFPYRHGRRLQGRLRGRKRRRSHIGSRPAAEEDAGKPTTRHSPEEGTAYLCYLPGCITRPDGNDVPDNHRRPEEHTGRRRRKGEALWQAIPGAYKEILSGEQHRTAGGAARKDRGEEEQEGKNHHKHRPSDTSRRHCECGGAGLRRAPRQPRRHSIQWHKDKHRLLPGRILR